MPIHGSAGTGVDETGALFKGGVEITSSSAELNTLGSVTAGTGAASKALVLGASATTIPGDVTFNDGTTDVDIASHDGTNGLQLGGTLVTATAVELNLTDGVTASTAEINSATDVSARHVDTGDVDTHVLLVADSGKTHTIPQVTGDIALTLPTAAAGIEYVLVSAAATAEGDNWVITATNDFVGGLAQVDTDGTAAAVLASGSSTNTCTKVAPLAGTSIRMICDGTNWLISGFVLAIAVPTFTNV